MKVIVQLLIAITIISSYGQDKDFDFGETEKGFYQNEFFNMEVSFDSLWVIQNKEQLNNLVKAGTDLVAGDDASLKAAVKASKVNTAYLLTVFKYEVGAAVTYNPSLMIIAENTKNFPGIKNGSDYLFHSKKLLQQSQMEYYFDKEIFTKKIGESEFHVMEAKIDYLGTTIVQEYMTTVTKGFSLSLIISYTTEEEKEELKKIIDNTKM